MYNCFSLSLPPSLSPSLCVCMQVFICHDSDTGMEMAVKAIDINHIDLRPHNIEAKRMQTVSSSLHASI